MIMTVFQIEFRPCLRLSLCSRNITYTHCIKAMMMSVGHRALEPPALVGSKARQPVQSRSSRAQSPNPLLIRVGFKPGTTNRGAICQISDEYA